MNTLYNNKYDIIASTIQPNPATVKYWADLSANPSGGVLKYFNGETWELVNNEDTEDIDTLKQDVETLKESKVDKVEGKQLSTEDFTTTEKSKLASLSNYDDSEIRELIESLEARVAALETPAA